MLSVVAILAVLFAVLSIQYMRRKEKATYLRMNELLDSAINNTFSSSTYDETMLSALESKLSRFLIVSKSSEHNTAEERNRIKALVSDISHQTKTPIANIMLYAQLLQEQGELSELSKNCVDEITIQSEKLSFLIQALVKTSRLETGLISVNPRQSSVAELLWNAVEAVTTKVKEKNMTLNVSCAEHLKALFDPKWTEEAIYNILDNGVKYTSTGGHISISAVAYELFIRIDIADNGMGIEEQDMNKIFRRFYRSVHVSSYEGVGIGLYLSREIISAEGGYMKVKSEMGKGTIFSVFLPSVTK
ncbi:signal transduction histidine kinase [Paenibacillus sp. DS2015]|uniref:sensor histidine kinase n=1 Tax=Paenibacillus sp. DS2015 TaxID=3373917 RepID=UPI003D213AE7